MDNINVVKTLHLWEKINASFKGKVFYIKDVYEKFTEEKRDSIRGRIYEHLGKKFQRMY
ncbi:hypothetical protein [Ruminococcus albus]|uniref:hypothetical protein n=1 Tax=Ruminococcus albus TaxID=1264 RepID=UPI0004B3F604|nr:hypothetical protein [Ruminococcus albus]